MSETDPAYGARDAEDAAPSLPASPEAERSLLGAVLIDGALLARVRGVVSPETFSNEAHRVTFEAMLSLSDRVEPVDLVTVQAELEKAGRLDRAGGAAYLSSLVDVVPDVEHVESYAKIVRESSLRRLVILESRRVAFDAQTAEIPKLLHGATAAFGELTRRAERDGGPEEPEAPARVVALDELLTEPEEPVSWLVEEILSEGALGMLAAEAYMTKSTLAGCLALHLAAGRDFLGWRILRPRPVLYWQTEGSVSRFKKRLAVAAAYYGIETKGLPLFLERTGLGEDFRSPAFREIAERVRGGLVIADTSGSFYFGDENSAEEVRAGWVRPLKAVAAECDVAVLTVHHHGKPSKERDGHHKGRGSSALFGDFDTWLRIEKVAGEPTHRALFIDKVREADTPPTVELAFLGDRAAFEVVTGETEADVKVDSKAELAAEKDRKAEEALALVFRQSPAGLTVEDARKANGKRLEWVAEKVAEFHARKWLGLVEIEKVDSRGRRIRVKGWKWQMEAA